MQNVLQKLLQMFTVMAKTQTRKVLRLNEF